MCHHSLICKSEDLIKFEKLMKKEGAETCFAIVLIKFGPLL